MASVFAVTRTLYKISKHSLRRKCIKSSCGYAITIRYRVFSSVPKNDGNTLLNAVNSVIKEPNGTASKSESTDEQKMESIIHQIRGLDPFAIDTKLAFASCQYMIRYHEQKLRKAAETAITSTAALRSEQRSDLQFGYILLQNILDETTDNNHKLMANTLKTELATKLRDGHLLSESFEELLEHEAEFTDQHLMIAFGTCSFVGDWPRMVKYGELMRNNGNSENDIPAQFDAVYDLIKNQYALHKYNNTEIERRKLLQWQTWRVLNIRIRLKDIDCEEWQDKQKEAMDEIVGADPTEWEDVRPRDVDHPHLNKQGGIWQTGSFCQQGITLSGPYFEDKIHVIGKDVYLDEQKQHVWTLTEELNLVQNEHVDKLFTGSYRLSQTAVLPEDQERTMETAPVHLNWDCELYLGEQIDES